MTNYPCTWFDRTDKMTPFIDGISSPILKNRETGEEVSSRDLPIGACYVINRPPDVTHRDDYPAVGEDGLAICCILPGGSHWYIESQASNCTNPTDRTHRCWVRHGTVGEPLTVDKAGHTCGAGAGSIFGVHEQKNWHGFLRNGVLVQC
jgi:hypothetical protein